MICEDIRNSVYVYLDGEFAPPETKVFERHLTDCSSCRELVQDEGTFLQAYKAKLHRPDVPPELELAIHSIAEQAPGKGASRNRNVRGGMTPRAWMQAAGWAAAACLVFGMVWWVGTVDNALEPDVRAAVNVHERDLPMEVRGTREDVRSYLQRNVAFNVSVPDEGVEGMRLTGARLVNVGNEPAVLYTYDVNGRRVSIVQMRSVTAGNDDSNEPVVEQHKGLSGFTYRKNGVYNTVVGNVRNTDLRRLIRVQP